VAAWRDNYHYQGYLWLHKPAVVYQADNSDDVDDGSMSVLRTGVSVGAIADVKPNMTVVTGSDTGKYDRGRVRVNFTDSDATHDFIYAWASKGLNDGELHGTDKLTVYDERRVWMKPPFANSTGDYFYSYLTEDPQPVAPDGMTFDQSPIANGGAGMIDFCDATSGSLSVTLSASDSFAVADDAVLGAYSSGLLSPGDPIYDSAGKPYTNLANAIDGNGATYANTSSSSSEAAPTFIAYDFGAGTEQAIRKIDVRSIQNFAPERFALQWSDNNTDWVTSGLFFHSWPASATTVTFEAHHAGEHRYWRLAIAEDDNVNFNRIYELQFYGEDRTAGSSPYLWDVGDGVITSGSTSTESVTVDFPPGFRYVNLEITDTTGTTGMTDIPVVVIQSAQSTSELWYFAGIFTATSEDPANTADKAFDNNDGTTWLTNSGVVTGTLQVQFALAKQADSYGVTVLFTSPAPKDWTLEGSNGAGWTVLDTQTGITTWSVGVEKTFSISSPSTYTHYRIVVTLNNGSATRLGIAELNLYGTEPDYDNAAVVDGAEVTAHTMEPAGQSMSFAIHEALSADDYHDGCLVMYFEREVYDGVAGSLAVAGSTGREHIKFIGWIDGEPTNIEADENGLITSTVLDCIDAGQRLRKLGAFSIMVEQDAVPADGFEAKHLNPDVGMYLIARWVSTVAEVTDFIWSHTLDHYSQGTMLAQGSSLYDQINNIARSIDHMLVCTKSGAVKIAPDILSCAGAVIATTATSETLTAADYTSIDYEIQPTGVVKWLEASGISTDGRDVDIPGWVDNLETSFTISPGNIPGQGVSTAADNEQVTGWYGTTDPFMLLNSTQSDNYNRAGKTYAQITSRVSRFTIRLVHAGDTGLDPASGEFLDVTLVAAIAAERGLTLSANAGAIRRITIQHDHEAQTKEVVVEWERQEDAIRADGYIP
jgi:hypothetical protein